MREFDMSVGAVLQALEIEDKFSGSGSHQRRYLACSDLEGHSMKNRHYSRSDSVFYDAEDFEFTDLLSRRDPPKFERVPSLLPDPKDPLKDDPQKDNIQENFVKAQVVFFTLDSPAYNNVDKQVLMLFCIKFDFKSPLMVVSECSDTSVKNLQIIVTLATLSFFCIRPTILALLNFTDAITAEVTADPREASSPDGNGEIKSADSDTLTEEKPAFERKDSIIKGLLGSGKDRTLFSLLLNMRQAEITLNTETGGQIASLAQEGLSCNIKVLFRCSIFGIVVSEVSIRQCL